MKGIIKKVLLATCVIGTSTCANAFPFREDPQSFQNYMNTMRWDDGSKVVFQNLGSCFFRTSTRKGGRGDMDYDNAGCSGGFITISNPLGIKICELRFAYYSKNINTNAIKTHYQPGNCRYK